MVANVFGVLAVVFAVAWGVTKYVQDDPLDIGRNEAMRKLLEKARDEECNKGV